MTHILKRIGMLLAAAALCCGAAAGEAVEVEEVSLGAAEAVTEKDGFHFDARGFLTGENPKESYLLEDEENGVWQYATADLSIRVKRFEEETEQKRKLLYCVAEVYASETSPLFAIMTPEPETSPRPDGYHLVYPENLVKDFPVMLAVSDDYYGYRQYSRDLNGAKWPTGIIIRNGKILYDKTRNSAQNRPFPNLDTLAVYGDGSMKTRICDEMTAEEYLEEGALQVFSFGPWLIRDGEANDEVLHPADRKGVMAQPNPRTVIGMVEPFHYVLIVVGTPTDKYTGVTGSWLIEKLQAFGCTEALNLDGGGTACMVFNGKTIIQGKWDKQKRVLGSMIAFGAVESFGSEEEQ